MGNKCNEQCGCSADCMKTECAVEEQGCAGCRSKGGTCGGSCAGCAGSCPRTAGDEFQWDYDDTVLVFSSDMLEEESP